MNLSPDVLGPLICGMRSAFARGENAMAHARATLGQSLNSPEATLVAYDLQAGSYTSRVRRSRVENDRWCWQLVDVLAPGFPQGGSLLEVGVGEATTLATVARMLGTAPGSISGFDLSWSRCAEARAWLREESVSADVFVGDLFAIPLADASVDVVYTSHSLEPNGGREREALRELLRVTRHRLVLCECLYELAPEPAQARMREHGYVRGLKDTLRSLGADVKECRLLPYSPNPLNPSGVIVVEKSVSAGVSAAPELRCPLTHTPLLRESDLCVSPLTGIVYPVLRGIPLLRAEHAVMASKLVPPPASAAALHT